MSEARSAGFPVPTPAGASTGGGPPVRLEKADIRSRLKKEGAFLGVLAAVFTLSLLMPWLRSHRLYFAPPCIFHTVTRVPCFLCGMTRSFVYTAQGDFPSAFEMHLLGPVLFFLLAGTAVYLAASLVSGYRVRLDLSPLARRVLFWAVLGTFMAAWIIKLAFMRGSW